MPPTDGFRATTVRYAGFRFLIEIDGVIRAGFSDVVGLDTSHVTEHAPQQAPIPKRDDGSKLSTIVLSAGVAFDPELHEWQRRVSEATHAPELRRVAIVLLGARGEKAASYRLYGASPVKLLVDEPHSDRRPLVIRGLELAHCGVCRE